MQHAARIGRVLRQRHSVLLDTPAWLPVRTAEHGIGSNQTESGSGMGFAKRPLQHRPAARMDAPLALRSSPMNLSLNLSSSSRAMRCSLLALALLGLAASGCQELGTLDVAQAEVVNFGSCAAVEDHVKREAVADLSRIREASVRGEVYSPFGYTSLGGAVSGNAGTITNHQEPGVAEADIFQLDGAHAFALTGRRLVIIETLGSGFGGGVLQVEGARKVAEVELAGPGIEMFLAGQDRLVVISHITQREVALLYESASTRPQRDSGRPVVAATVFDISDRTAPRELRQVAVEGELVASRRIGDQIYLIARAGLGGPVLLPPAEDEDPEVWLQTSTARIQSAQLDAWLPWAYSTTLDGRASASRIDCGAIYGARTASGDDALGIYSFDVRDPESEVKATTFVGDGTLAYASKDSVIVAHTNYATARFGGGNSDSVQATTLHRFELKEDGGTRYSASGIVHGWILNAFGLSEYEGHIRVATQVDRFGTGYKPINVFTLPITPRTVAPLLSGPAAPVEESDGKAYLQVGGELIDIAHGEDLFAVRFAGDIGYVVTWIEVKGDPLFTIDLKNPSQPQILGELQIPGFSTYLHPIAGGRLLGVGRTANDEVKVSLFDVRNLRQPNALHELGVGGAGADSEAIEEHRAFRYLPEERLLALPINGSNGSELVVYQVDERSLRQLGSVRHGNAAIRRSYAVGGHLYVMSDAGVTITSLSDLGVRARVDF